jgi:hypothetical protein
MRIAEEVARLEAENERLRATLTALLNAVKTAAIALDNGALPEPEGPIEEPLPEMEQVERKGIQGAYRVDSQDVLSRMGD